MQNIRKKAASVETFYSRSNACYQSHCMGVELQMCNDEDETQDFQFYV